MATLVASGFVEQDRSTRRYSLASKAFWVGAGYLRHSRVYRYGLSVLQDLASDTNTTCHLAFWDGDAILLLHTSLPAGALNVFFDTGERRPIHANALGKVMLAYRPVADLKRIFARPVE